jgi:sodium-dependent dicarboxylate transporter 2/3/5
MPQDQPRGSRRVARAGLVLGLVLALMVGSGPHWGFSLDSTLSTADQFQLSAMAATALLMAIWWLTEAIPLAATALVPLVLFPALRILPSREVAAAYGDHVIFLFLGGFLIALAVEESGLHRRVALATVAALGDNPRRVVLGFMAATAGLSMWISNTAATMLMLPIAVSVLGQTDQIEGEKPQESEEGFGVALLLGIAYAASIGGVATLIGTPPNIAFKAQFEQQFVTRPPVTFFQWMVLALPLALLFLVIAWLLLTRWVFRLSSARLSQSRSIATEQLRSLGRMTKAERRVAVIFVVTALMWILREPVAGVGWSPLLGYEKGTVTDGTVAILMAILCFMIPSGTTPGRPLLLWTAARRVPWGLLLLFGGGLALAAGLTETGLDVYLGERMAVVLAAIPQLGQMAAVAFGMTWLTEMTSNTASVNMICPILAGTAKQLGCSPLLLMLPATLAASCAFMLPVATPPNAIVYGSGRLRIADMIKAGFWLNLIGVILVVLSVAVFGTIAFGSAAIWGA